MKKLNLDLNIVQTRKKKAPLTIEKKAKKELNSPSKTKGSLSVNMSISQQNLYKK